MKYHYKQPIHAPCIDKREKKTGPVIVNGKEMPGPVSLEQYYGRTLNLMEWQPRGNYWEPPVSYWTKPERLQRLKDRQ